LGSEDSWFHPFPQPDGISIRELEDDMGACPMIFAPVGFLFPVFNLITPLGMNWVKTSLNWVKNPGKKDLTYPWGG